MKLIFGIRKMAGYKKLFFLVLIVFISKNLFSQTPVSPDSITTFTDSLKIGKISKDSLQFKSKSEIIQLMNLNSYILNPISQIPFVFHENLHFYLPFDDFTKKEINNFILFHPEFSTSLYFQLFFPVYQINNNFDYISFSNKIYHDKVPLMISYAGIGSEDMNFAYMDFFKGSIHDKIDLNFSYIGESGNWNLINNSSRNFHIFSSYNCKSGKFYFIHDDFKREIPAFYFTNAQSQNSKMKISVKRNESKFTYKKFDIGFQTEKINADSLINEQNFQILFSQSLDTKLIDLTVLYNLKIHSDSLFHYPSIKSKIEFGNFVTNLYYQNNLKKSLLNIKTYYKYKNHLKLGLEYKIDDIFHNFEQKNLSLEYKKSAINAGIKKKNASSCEFVEIFQKNKLRFTSDYILNFTNEIQFNNKQYNYFPYLQLKSNFQITKVLKYKNAIYCGMEYFFITTDKKIKIYDIFLHPYIGVNITDKFSLQVDFINITNEFSYNMLSLSPYHINVGFKWIFFN